jgi:hypothetical protein
MTGDLHWRKFCVLANLFLTDEVLLNGSFVRFVSLQDRGFTVLTDKPDLFAPSDGGHGLLTRNDHCWWQVGERREEGSSGGSSLLLQDGTAGKASKLSILRNNDQTIPLLTP